MTVTPARTTRRSTRKAASPTRASVRRTTDNAPGRRTTLPPSAICPEPQGLPRADDLFDVLARASRRLLVLEQLFRVAAVDPDGQPFAVPEAEAFYQELAILIREVRQQLRLPPGVPLPG